MGEHLLCKQEVIGSNPFASTNARDVERGGGLAGSGYSWKQVLADGV